VAVAQLLNTSTPLAKLMQGISVYLVEDEALIRMMVVEMLQELGYRIVGEAGSIRAAEPLARTAVFDLGIFDINIAGQSIAPIAEIVASRGLPFIFISGYGSSGVPEAFSDRPLLRKPFLVADLVTAINSVLGGP
jgi:DNA-binding NarL/FixJ family response regulator